MSRKDEDVLHPSNSIAFCPYSYNESEEKKAVPAPVPVPVPTNTKKKQPPSKIHPSNYAFYNEVTQSQIKNEISSSDSFSLT